MLSFELGMAASTSGNLLHRQALGASPCIRATRSRARAFVPRALKQADTKPSSKDVKRSTATAWGKKKLAVPTEPDEPQQQGWGLLDLQAYNRKWDVPWGPVTTIAGLGAWALSFAAVGFYVVPKLYLLSGLDLRNATATDKATYTLAVQSLQTLAGIGVIRFFADKYRGAPPADLPDASAAASTSGAEKVDDELFNYSPLQPFRSPNGWLFWGILGMVAAPFVVGTLAYTLTAVGYDKAYSETRGTVDGIVPIISAGPATYLSLLAVTGGLAPLLEETIFRGFLLTSLTKYFPTWVAVLGSSLCFGAAHFSARDFPVLTGLGILLGFSYVRSRNLLTPMLIHGAWNSTVLSVLFYLSSSGIDVTQLLRDVKDVQ